MKNSGKNKLSSNKINILLLISNRILCNKWVWVLSNNRNIKRTTPLSIMIKRETKTSTIRTQTVTCQTTTRPRRDIWLILRIQTTDQALSELLTIKLIQCLTTNHLPQKVVVTLSKTLKLITSKCPSNRIKTHNSLFKLNSQLLNKVMNHFMNSQALVWADHQQRCCHPIRWENRLKL